jgi:hypothetical protein
MLVFQRAAKGFGILFHVMNFFNYVNLKSHILNIGFCKVWVIFFRFTKL